MKEIMLVLLICYTLANMVKCTSSYTMGTYADCTRPDRAQKLLYVGHYFGCWLAVRPSMDSERVKYE